MEYENFHKNKVKTYGLLTSLQLKSKGQCEKSKLKQLNLFCKKPNENMTLVCLLKTAHNCQGLWLLARF